MTPEPAPTPPPAPKSNFFRLPRRDFYFGGIAGFLAGKASEYVQPVEWTRRTLPRGTQLSFAQSGEDLILAGLFDALAVARPSYLDIGAWEPIESNNTYLAYRQGGRGVLVEPNPTLTPKLRSTRPGDVVLEAGIGIGDASAADYYELDQPQLNTFDKEQAEKLQREHGRRIERVTKMPLIGINRVIAEHFGGKAPDLVSIDIEGLDLAVIQTLDLEKFRPKVICAETIITMTRRHNPATTPYLEARGYEVRGMTFANTIYVDRRAAGW